MLKGQIVAVLLAGVGLLCAEQSFRLSEAGRTIACSLTAEPGSTIGRVADWQYLGLAVSDSLHGSTSSNLASVIDSMSMTDTAFDMMASLVRDNEDTVHICYRMRSNGTDRVFYARSNAPVNVSRVQPAKPLTWKSRLRISTAATEPASGPTIALEEGKVTIEWKTSPDVNGWTETFRSSRTLDSPLWSLPFNITPEPGK
jgi:hypothetical protein